MTTPPTPTPTSTTDMEIFRAGTHTAMSGQAVTVTADDLTAIARRYDPAHQEAPIVVGHPTTNGPAYGWVTGLRVEGDRLVATAGQVDPAFAALVRAGRYKKISACFSGLDGKPFALRHVGFLGATPPAVKGLRDAQFADDGGPVLTFDFAAAAPPNPRENSVDPTVIELQAKLAEAQARAAAAEAEKATLAQNLHAFAERDRDHRRAADQVRLEKLVREGRLLPRELPALGQLVEFLDGNGATVLEFAEGTTKVKRSPKDALLALLAARPKMVEYKELTGGADSAINFADPVAISDAAAAYEAQMAQRGTPVTAADAVMAVMRRRS